MATVAAKRRTKSEEEREKISGAIDSGNARQADEEVEVELYGDNSIGAQTALKVMNEQIITE